MIRCGATLLAATLATPALGAPPYATDDAGVLAPGEFEAIPYLDAVFASGPDSGETGLDANIGVFPKVQLGLTVPVHRFEAGRDRLSLGDVALNAKIALVESTGELAVAFGPSLMLPTGSGGREKAGFSLPLWGTVPVGDWSIHAGGGFRLAARQDGGDLPFGGIVAERPIAENVSLGAELYGEGKGAGGATMIMAGPGLAWALSGRFTLVAAGHAILTNRQENGHFHIYTALIVTP